MAVRDGRLRGVVPGAEALRPGAPPRGIRAPPPAADGPLWRDASPACHPEPMCPLGVPMYADPRKRRIAPSRCVGACGSPGAMCDSRPVRTTYENVFDASQQIPSVAVFFVIVAAH